MYKTTINRKKGIQEIVLNWKKQLMHQNNVESIKMVLKYQKVTSLKSSYDFEIEKDIERTFPHDKSYQRKGPNFKKLFRILRAVANYDQKIGYV